MKITTGWRKYYSDYKELRGDGLISHIIHPKFCVNQCPTEAFVGVLNSKNRTKLYIPSIAYIWDNEEIEPGNHGVLIYFFDEKERLLGGEQGGGAHQFPADGVGTEARAKLVRIASDFMMANPNLASLTHAIVTQL